MAKFIVLGNFTPDAIDGMMANPSDRVKEIRALLDGVGGRLESYYWMQGQYDFVSIVDAPTAMDANAVSLAVTSSRRFSHFETHELIAPEDIVALLKQAQEIRKNFAAPGTLTTAVR